MDDRELLPFLTSCHLLQGRERVCASQGCWGFHWSASISKLSENLLGPVVGTGLAGVGFKDEQQQPLSQET